MRDQNTTIMYYIMFYPVSDRLLVEGIFWHCTLYALLHSFLNWCICFLYGFMNGKWMHLNVSLYVALRQISSVFSPTQHKLFHLLPNANSIKPKQWAIHRLFMFYFVCFSLWTHKKRFENKLSTDLLSSLLSMCL